MHEAILKRIDNRLANMAASKPKKDPETWVKASVIVKLTGWNAEGMRTARKYNYITWRKDEDRIFWYLLESLNTVFIKK